MPMRNSEFIIAQISDTSSLAILMSSALFVTWNITSSSRPDAHPELRGCIGNFAPMMLAKGLKDYALIRSAVYLMELANVI
jgi:AMMECR1 domain-containing protein